VHHEQEQQNGCNTVFPRDMVFLRNINTPHKGDDGDNNNNILTLETKVNTVNTEVWVRYVISDVRKLLKEQDVL
jgi:hypothetical protein